MSTYRSWSHYISWLASFLVIAIFAGIILPRIAGWIRSQRAPSPTVALFTLNISANCQEHNWTEHVCSDNRYVNAAIATVFATERDCQGIRVRGVTDKESYMPPAQIPGHLLNVYYEKDPSAAIDETQSWTFWFYGPHGTISGTTRTQEMVRMVCRATKGLGADVERQQP